MADGCLVDVIGLQRPVDPFNLIEIVQVAPSPHQRFDAFPFGYGPSRWRSVVPSEVDRRFGNWTIETVKRSPDAVGFQLMPRRWVVERTLAWFNRNRRLTEDFEASIASAKAWVYIASVQLLIRRLT